MQKPHFSSCTIDDLLVSQPTIALITALKLDGALQHLRVYGNKRGQRVRERTTHSRDNATLVTIKLEDGTAALTATTLLVEDAWAQFTSGSMSGGIAGGSSDAQIALAEIEARLRNDPSLIDVYQGSAPRATHTASPVARPVLPPVLPPRATARIALSHTSAKPAVAPVPVATIPPVPPVEQTTEVIQPSATDNDPHLDQGNNPPDHPVTKGPQEPEERLLHNCDTDGIPRVIFEEYEPAAGGSDQK